MASGHTFGHLRDGRTVQIHELAGPDGMTARVLNLGASLAELRVPDRKGNREDILLGHADAESYLRCPDCHGAIVGRIAGRVNRGRICVCGTEYALVTNEPPHHIHGGVQGLGRRLWEVVESKASFLRLRYESPDGEEGYPGTLGVEVEYRFTSRSELRVRLRATTDHATPVTLCPHVGFNLSGTPGRTIHDHGICLFSHEYLAMEKDLSFTGESLPVEESPCDLNVRTRMGDILGRLFQQHGDMYRIQRSRRGDLVPAARLWHPESGRVVHIATTQPFVQLYTGSRISSRWPGKHGRPYPRFGGIWLNCQGYPNGTLHPALDNLVLKPGERYDHQVVYAFDTLPD